MTVKHESLECGNKQLDKAILNIRVDTSVATKELIDFHREERLLR